MIKMFHCSFVSRSSLRFVRRFYNSLPDVVVECLQSRALLRVAGPTAGDFLQGLITNDIRHIAEGSPCMYTMFLNTKGRVLYDSIVYNGDEANAYIIECDTTIAKDLESHLKKFKVRRKISIDNLSSEYSVWTVGSSNIINDVLRKCNPIVDPTSAAKSILGTISVIGTLKAVVDPRISALGIRVISPKGEDLPLILKKNGIVTTEDNFYRSLRYRLGVGEGVSELPVGNCFPLEANCDYLHGVSFHKGCYIGQELTARTHHTGVIRKRHMPIVFDETPLDITVESPVLTDISLKLVGKLRGWDGNYGIALLRIEEVLKDKKLKIGICGCKTFRPYWWPNEAPRERPI